jgi:16S rRNA (guanine(966)-N(2))-methyltransferase RsmD
MRIIGGEARGRSLLLPRGCRGIRPTTDRVKESLFAILHPVAGLRFLDLFAGCGNVGLESLSRGACFAAFVEREARLAETIHRNLELLGFEGRAEVVTADAGMGMKRLAKRGERFDILFADPPYEEGLLSETIAGLEETDLLAEDGIAVLQHSVREMPEGSQMRKMAVADQRRYGDTILTFLKAGAGE